MIPLSLSPVYPTSCSTGPVQSSGNHFSVNQTINNSVYIEVPVSEMAEGQKLQFQKSPLGVSPQVERKGSEQGCWMQVSIQWMKRVPWGGRASISVHMAAHPAHHWYLFSRPHGGMFTQKQLKQDFRLNLRLSSTILLPDRSHITAVLQILPMLQVCQRMDNLTTCSVQMIKIHAQNIKLPAQNETFKHLRWSVCIYSSWRLPPELLHGCISLSSTFFSKNYLCLTSLLSEWPCIFLNTLSITKHLSV